MEELYAQIANMGFPIVISVYLLMRIEGKLENLSLSIQDLAKVVARLH
ncbi:YvrJ family protein [Lutibacter sp. B2]|nr:YvrJ family protein [Lutibacter sp. B2]